MPRAADQSPDFLTKVVTFRGVEYTVRELSIGEFDDITEQATVKRTIRDADGNETEVEQLDGQLQARLMMRACVTPTISAGTTSNNLSAAASDDCAVVVRLQFLHVFNLFFQGRSFILRFFYAFFARCRLLLQCRNFSL